MTRARGAWSGWIFAIALMGLLTQQAQAVLVRGVGTGALIGNDLSDPENDGNPGADSGYNATFAANDKPFFDGGEGAFNIYDNEVGGGNSKWCCGPGGGIPAEGLHSTATLNAGAHYLERFTVASGNDSPNRRPTVWKIQGSNDGVTFTDIFSQDNAAPLWTADDQVLQFDAGVDFPVQTEAYNSYRIVTLDTTDNPNGAYYQLNEVEYFGVAATRATQGRIDITAPGDLITAISGTNDGDGDSGPPPANEGVANAIDNTTNKYLNFLDLGSGLEVTPAFGESVVTGLRVYTANDGTERDPASYRLEGSTDGVLFELISEGALALPLGRNNAGQLIFYDEVNFDNTGLYATYRLTFPTLRDAGAANSMQIGEIELLGTAAAAIPEPASAMLGILGLGALAMRRRRLA